LGENLTFAALTGKYFGNRSDDGTVFERL